MYNRPTVIWGLKVGGCMVMVDAESIRQEGRFARQECVAAPGIPANTVKNPGAATQPRHPASAGFRAIDTTNNFGSTPNALNINAPVLQDTYSAGVIQPNNRLYFAQDANWDPGAAAHTREGGTGFRAVEAEYANELSRFADALNTTSVVGLVGDTWQVMQRYVYSPYGTITILNADWSATPSGTVPLVNNLFQGMANDPVTGLYYERARWYSTSLGTWISQDPAGFVNGADTYQFVGSGPVGAVDPWGMATVPTTVGGLLATMIPGAGHFDGTLTNHGPEASYLSLSFVLSKNHQCGCDRVEFEQFYQQSWVAFPAIFSGSTLGWQLDDKPYPGQTARVPPPFYPDQFPGSGAVPAMMTDLPGAPAPLPVGLTLFSQTFATFAVCTKGKDAGHALGEEVWGHVFHFTRGLVYELGGAPSTVTRMLEGAHPAVLTGKVWSTMKLTIN